MDKIFLELRLKIVKGELFMLEFARKMLWGLTDNMEKSTKGIWFKAYYGIVTIPIVVVFIPLYVIKKIFESIK